MSYTTNPYLPKLRAKAVVMVQRGHSMRATARYFGVEPSTISRWMQHAPADGTSLRALPTTSSRPKHSPRAVDPKIVHRIREIRLQRHRCADAIWYQLRREGITVSLSTVKRTLTRHNLLRPRSPWKKYHLSGERPVVTTPGTLVEIDSVHFWPKPPRVYLSTMIDVYSRWAFVQRITALRPGQSVLTVQRAQHAAPFTFQCVQSDHGSEFSKYFSLQLKANGIRHRQIRIRTPNDNAHIERFNRTLQDECGAELKRYLRNPVWFTRTLYDYLTYYNSQRVHLGLHGSTPFEVLQRS